MGGGGYCSLSKSLLDSGSVIISQFSTADFKFDISWEVVDCFTGCLVDGGKELRISAMI